MAFEVKGNLSVTGDGDVDGVTTGGSSGGGPVPFVTAKAFGAGVDNMTTILSGTGVVMPSVETDGVSMTVGGTAKVPGRIYCEGRKLMTSGNEIFLLGANTPYFAWNDFGRAAFNIELWRTNFQKMVACGGNCIQVWFNCDPANEGITLTDDGVANAPTAKFWQDCDAFFALAEEYKIYVIASMLSFDHFMWNNPGTLKYHLMIGSEATVQAYVDNVIVPFVVRYKDNVYLMGVSPVNECDNSYEDMEKCTPREGTCRPVGGGSQFVDFDFRVDDFVVGRMLTVNGTSMGLVIERTSDTRVKCENSYSGASASFGLYDWGWNTMSWDIFPRYIAFCAQGIHRSGSPCLVTAGFASMKWTSPLNEGGDTLSDSALAGYTGDAASKLDFHSPHFYSWAEAWFTTFVSPQTAGLTNKPAVVGEISAIPGECNLSGVYERRVHAGFNYDSGGWIVRRKNPRTSKWEYYNHTGNGYSGWYDFPLSDETGGAANVGNTVVDGDLTLTRIEPRTWKPNTYYSWGQLVLSDDWGTDGRCRIYRNTKAGVSGSTGYGPMGLTEFGYNPWSTSTVYALNAMVSANNFYWKCTTAGQSASSGSGPAIIPPVGGSNTPDVGPGETRTDGTCVWTCESWATTLNDGGCVWEFKRDPWDSYADILGFFRDNGWSGVLPWTSHCAGYNGSLYHTRFNNPNYSIPNPWQASTYYYAGDVVLSDGYKLYRCVGAGTTGTTGPSGTSRTITDGTAVWCYYETTDADLLTESGLAMKSVSDTMTAKIYPSLDENTGELTVGTVVRQSPYPTIYVPGADITSTLTFKFDGGVVGLNQRVGWFDSSDGIFLKRSGTSDSLVVRRKGVDTPVARANWNVDQLDGSGLSGVTIDLSCVNVLVIAAGWLHGNVNRVGFMVEGKTYWAHEFSVCNVAVPLVPSNPNLPLRWEVDCESGFESISSMESFVGHASRIPVGLSVSSGVVTGEVWANASITNGIAGLRMGAAGAKVGMIRPTRVFVQDNAGEQATENWWQVFRWWLVLNPDYWYNPVYAASGGLAEVCISELGATPSSGTILSSGYVHRNVFDSYLPNMPWLKAGDEVVLYVTNLSQSNRGYKGGIVWEERT